MIIYLSRLHFPVSTLGPGRRIGIWFQGCSIRCPGCISVDTWVHRIRGVRVEEVINAIGPWLKDADGITISGGEPFDQAGGLYVLLSALRKQSHGDVLVYSGYPRERIADHLARMEGLIDALVSDPYDFNASQTLALRGSDNQRLHLLTSLGALRFASYERSLTDAERTLDIMFDKDGTVWMAGIPRKDDLHRLVSLLQQDGHRAWTSQALTHVKGPAL
jgi:anaerobic ribonucleoside-triphosphate reductase activating protein